MFPVLPVVPVVREADQRLMDLTPVPTILGTLPAGASGGTVALGQGDWSGTLHLDQPAYVWVSTFYADGYGGTYFDGWHRDAVIDGLDQWRDYPASWRVLPAGDHTVSVIGGADSWGVSVAVAPEPGPILLGAMVVIAAAWGMLRRKRT